MRSILITLAALLVGAGSLAAQAVQPGARVRISAPEMYNNAPVAGTGAWQVGEVTAVDTGWVTVRLESSQVKTFPFASIQQMEVSRGAMSNREGSRRGIVAGAAVGAVVGAVFIGVMKAAQGNDCGNGQSGCTPRTPFIKPNAANLALTMGAGAVLGGGVGAALGSTSHERWVAVPLPGSRVSVGVSRESAGLALRLPL